MRSETLHTGWTCRHLSDPEPGTPVILPHDAARTEKRTADSAGGTNTGWVEGYDYLYEKTLTFTPEECRQTVVLEFEGVYHNAEVLLDGKTIMRRPYGYTNFYADLTGKIQAGREHRLSVIARNADQPNSRWYSGAGIYRPVRLWRGPMNHIALNGLKVRTISLDPAEIEVTIKTTIPGEVTLQILEKDQVIAEGKTFTGRLRMQMPQGKAWSPDTPIVYTCRAFFQEDRAETTFGLRTISWGKDGFKLNGERMILQGACIHHDNGLLGAVCDPDAVERKVRLLQENGYNAIRSAHNPCSKILLDVCDRMGMLVMDEYIDHWYIHKTKYDYVDYFDAWWHQDLTDMVEKDYNHPCVILYSTGNEVSETAQKKGILLTGEMTKYLHSLDDTRPVTCGVNIFFNFLSSIGFGVYSDEKAKKEAEKAEAAKAEGKAVKEKAVGSQFFNNLAGLLGDEFMKRGATLHGCDVRTRDAFAKMDIAGYNYGIYRYEHDLKKYENRLILGSETFCNDAYRFRELAKKEPRLIGDFVWAGMDYLGEVMVGSWEYKEYAPRFDGGLGWVSAGSGRIDLTGKPLGEALYTRVALEKENGPYIAVRPVHHSGEKHSPSAWKMTDAMESWSFRDCDGKKAVVEVYARAFFVELILNGKRVGKKKAKNDCRFVFNVRFHPGTLEAAAFDAEGKEIGRTALHTAARQTVLSAEPETATVRPGGLLYVRLSYTDPSGIIKPMEKGDVRVVVQGGELLALGNGCPYNKEGYLSDTTKTYYGEALAIIRAGDSGKVLVAVMDKTHTARAVVPIVSQEIQKLK